MPSALALARARRRAPTWSSSAMGPGVVGTGTALGTTAVEVAPILDAAGALGRRPVAVRAGVRRRRRAAPPGGQPPHPHRRSGCRRAGPSVPVPRGAWRASSVGAHHVVERRRPRRRPRVLDARRTCRSRRWAAGPTEDPAVLRRGRRGGGAAGPLRPCTPGAGRRWASANRSGAALASAPMSAAKLERLLNLMALLLETPRPLSAHEIRDACPAPTRRRPTPSAAPSSGTRTSCAAMGIPLVVAATSRRRTRRSRATASPRTGTTCATPGSTPDELAALRLAASAVRLDGLAASEGLLEAGRPVARPDEPARPRRGPPARHAASSPCSGRRRADAGAPSPTRRASARSTRTGSASSGAAGTSAASTTAGTASGCSGSTASTAPSRRWRAGRFERPATAVPGRAARAVAARRAARPVAGPGAGRRRPGAHGRAAPGCRVRGRGAGRRRGGARPDGDRPRRLPLVRPRLPRARRGARPRPSCGPTSSPGCAARRRERTVSDRSTTGRAAPPPPTGRRLLAVVPWIAGQRRPDPRRGVRPLRRRRGASCSPTSSWLIDGGRAPVHARHARST